MGLWIIREGTATERSRKWSARYSSGNDTRMTTLLGLWNIRGWSTRPSCTENLNRHYLAKAASVSLWVIRKGTTLERRREWSARYASWKDAIVATLLGMRKVEGLSTRQSGTGRLKGNNLIEAASVGLWIVG